jgi:hypothetical protein
MDDNGSGVLVRSSWWSCHLGCAFLVNYMSMKDDITLMTIHEQSALCHHNLFFINQTPFID